MIKALLLLALAGTYKIDWSSSFDVEGWSEDGQYFAWTGDGSSYVFNARTSQVSQVPQLAAWKKSHPLKPSVAARTSLDGKAKAEVRIIRAPAKGENGWDKNSWSPSAQQVVELRVVRDDQSALSINWHSGAFNVEPHWSPDGLRVAWVVVTSDRAQMDGSTSREIGVGPAQGGRIHLLADKALLAGAAPKVAAALEKAGFAPTFVGPAKKAREASVVYAAAGSEALAAKIAAAVPGGATVDKLSWETEADVVVAIGKTAVQGGK